MDRKITGFYFCDGSVGRYTLSRIKSSPLSISNLRVKALIGYACAHLICKAIHNAWLERHARGRLGLFYIILSLISLS